MSVVLPAIRDGKNHSRNSVPEALKRPVPNRFHLNKQHSRIVRGVIFLLATCWFRLQQYPQL